MQDSFLSIICIVYENSALYEGHNSLLVSQRYETTEWILMTSDIGGLYWKLDFLWSTMTSTLHEARTELYQFSQ
jgi:hypothetical protein